MVGAIDATCSDQPAKINFSHDRILLQFESMQSLRALRLGTLPSAAKIGQVLSFSGQKLFARIGQGKKIELFPNPRWWVRLLSPQVRQLAKAAN